MKKNHIETCFTPRLFSLFDKKDKLVVVADIFRATSSICAAFENGAKEIVAVSEKAECISYKEKGFIIAGERDGKILDYADIGNSPDGFMQTSITGKSIAMNTTNGSRSIKIAAEEKPHMLVIGAFVNLDALSDFLIERNKNVLIFSAGWKDHFSLEDSLFAGALADNILNKAANTFNTCCDATHAAIDMWKTAKSNPRTYIDKASHRIRLKHMKLDNSIDYCMTLSITNVIPVLYKNKLVDYYLIKDSLKNL